MLLGCQLSSLEIIKIRNILPSRTERPRLHHRLENVFRMGTLLNNEHIQIYHLSVCVWIFPKWVRWYPLIEVFHVKTTDPAWENERLISCFLKDHNSKGFLGVRVEFVNMKSLEFGDIRVFKTNNSFAIQKILRFPVH